MRVLVFGDSITQGYWDTEGGWTARIRKHYDEKELQTGESTPAVFNMGVSADTSADLVARFENEVKVRIHNNKLAIVIAIGVNDTQVINGQNIAEVDDYRQNLADLLKTARKYSDKIIFVGLTPCIDERTNPVEWEEDVSYSNGRIAQFNAVLESFVADNNIPFVEMYKPFQSEQAKRDLLPDGLHPNNEGHQFMADLILPKLEEMVS